ncbi:hypothetical protein [Cellulomonas edaphi]|uniref:Alpha/beta hydrolase n=1 Tax=Cellulomonas edaphi TaxID=3053468 RepID=A0ABT7S305_9CELL|nr:hypothetical protein [Cellulomons edaphi]MDM7830009.1 hypothetical protein [Cellulomons edaphi]
MSGSPWGDGSVRAVGGPGPTAVELGDLERASAVLRAAVDALWRADARLRAAGLAEQARSMPALVDGPRPAFAASHTDALGRSALLAARHVDDLLRRLRHVLRRLDEAEWWVGRAMHAVVTAEAHVAGEVPALLPAVVPFVVPAAVGAWVGARGDATRVAGAAASAQVPSALVAPTAAFLRGALPGARPPATDPLGALAGEAASGELPPAVLLPRADPPALPVPRSAADLLRNVSATYPSDHGGLPGTARSSISVQRLTHPDGTRGWVVEIPGTQSAAFGGDVATDMATNARLMGGLPDDMSTAVLHVLRDLGVPPDEPVLLAGHSQGGMVAVTAAVLAAGAYDVRAVLTAGSPDVPRTLPAGVQARHYRIDEDVVPQTDGRADVVSGDVVAVRRSIGAANVAHAHALEEYVRTAELADAALAGSPALRRFDAELARVLGPPGTTQRTWQLAVTRSPALVRTDPGTGLPRTPQLRAATSPGRPGAGGKGRS